MRDFDRDILTHEEFVRNTKLVLESQKKNNENMDE